MNLEEMALSAIILLLPLVGLYFAWRSLAGAIAYATEQRLYGLRDKVYDLVLDGKASFDQPVTDDFISYIHAGISITRSRDLQDQLADALRTPGGGTLPAFFDDARYEKLAHSATWLILQVVSTRLFSRQFMLLWPFAIRYALTAMTKSLTARMLTLVQVRSVESRVASFRHCALAAA